MSGIRLSSVAWPSPFDLVVVAASAGGITAVSQVLAALPSSFPAAVVVVQHRSVRGDCFADIISRRTDLVVRSPRARTNMAPGVVHVVPPDCRGSFSGARTLLIEHAARCHADPLLASAARVYGRRMIAVVLTGRLDDGAEGVREVKRHGGRVIVQDKDTSASFGMPAAAIATGCVDFVLPLGRIATALVALTMAPGAADLFSVGLSPWASMAV